MRVYLQDENIVIDVEVIGVDLVFIPQNQAQYTIVGDEVIVFDFTKNDCRFSKDLIINVKDEFGPPIGEKPDVLDYLNSIIPRANGERLIFEPDSGGGANGLLVANEGTGSIGSGTAMAWVLVNLGVSFANNVVFIGVTSTNGIPKTVSVRTPGDLGISDDITGNNSTNFIVQCNASGQIEIFTTNTNVIFKHKTTLSIV